MIEQAEQLATKVRESFNMTRFPIDPVTIAHKFGLRVVDGDLPTNVSGALIKEKGNDPVIMLESKDSLNRQRFTCAHELGHFIWRSENDEEASAYEYIEYRSEDREHKQKEEEIFANAFAAALLMPAGAVQKMANEPKVLLAKKFGVSVDAMKYRLKNLGYGGK